MIISSTGLFPNLRLLTQQWEKRLWTQQWENVIKSWKWKKRGSKRMLPLIYSLSVEWGGMPLFLLLLHCQPCFHTTAALMQRQQKSFFRDLLMSSCGKQFYQMIQKEKAFSVGALNMPRLGVEMMMRAEQLWLILGNRARNFCYINKKGWVDNILHISLLFHVLCRLCLPCFWYIDPGSGYWMLFFGK